MTRDDIHSALMADDPVDKCRRVDELAVGDAGVLAGETGESPVIAMPGRPSRPQLVHPAKLPRRGLGTVESRAALVHAIAHIEFNAINLGLDAAWRFTGMPADFYRDWLRVAADETRHFRLLSERLGELGFAYGDFDAHNGLWEAAVKTAHDVLVRMALVPRVLEARGLDVTPGMIKRLTGAGDRETVAILEIILEEEVPHVAIGTRWFRHCCEQRGEDPDTLFPHLLETYMNGGPPGPYNFPDRRRAGFAESELEYLQERNSSA